MRHHLIGRIEVICGPMFSGKTEELIRRVRRAMVARQRVQIFKPAIDTRFHKTDVVSHSSISLEADPVQDSSEIIEKLQDVTRIVAIDEIQFFDHDIIDVVSKLSRRGLQVICAGLDMDYKGVPFGPIPTLLAKADEVHKIQAICTICGEEATKTFRTLNEGEQVLVGEKDIYEARCTFHWNYDTGVNEMNGKSRELFHPNDSLEAMGP